MRHQDSQWRLSMGWLLFGLVEAYCPAVMRRVPYLVCDEHIRTTSHTSSLADIRPPRFQWEGVAR